MNFNIPTPLEMQEKLKAQLSHQELLEVRIYFIRLEKILPILYRMKK
jgi:hypothetical protein